MSTSPGATAPTPTIPFAHVRRIVYADRARGALAVLTAVKAADASAEAQALEIRDVEKMWGDYKVRPYSALSSGEAKKVVGRCAGRSRLSEQALLGDYGLDAEDPAFLAAVAAEKERRATVSAAAKAAAQAPKKGAKGGDFSAAGDESEAATPVTATVATPAVTPTSRPAPEAAAEAEAPPLPKKVIKLPAGAPMSARLAFELGQPGGDKKWAPKAGARAADNGTFLEHYPAAARMLENLVPRGQGYTALALFLTVLSGPEAAATAAAEELFELLTEDEKRSASAGMKIWGQKMENTDAVKAVVVFILMEAYNGHPRNLADVGWAFMLFAGGIDSPEDLRHLVNVASGYHAQTVPVILGLLRKTGYKWYQKPKDEPKAAPAAAPAIADPAMEARLRKEIEAQLRREFEERAAKSVAAASVASAPASAPAPKPAHVPTPPPATTVQPSAPARKRPWWKFWAK